MQADELLGNLHLFMLSGRRAGRLFRSFGVDTRVEREKPEPSSHSSTLVKFTGGNSRASARKTVRF